jgi:hypothetical protein
MVSRHDDDPESPSLGEGERERSTRFHVAHRGGARIEVGEPVHVGGNQPWMCAVKLVGRRREEPVDGDATQTLLVRMGRGATAEDARRNALAQLTLVYGSPVEPPPNPVITQKASVPPIPLPAPNAGQSPRPSTVAPSPAIGEPMHNEPGGWLSRLVGRIRGT